MTPTGGRGLHEGVPEDRPQRAKPGRSLGLVTTHAMTVGAMHHKRCIVPHNPLTSMDFGRRIGAAGARRLGDSLRRSAGRVPGHQTPAGLPTREARRSAAMTRCDTTQHRERVCRRRPKASAFHQHPPSQHGTPRHPQRMGPVEMYRRKDPRQAPRTAQLGHGRDRPTPERRSHLVLPRNRDRGMGGPRFAVAETSPPRPVGLGPQREPTIREATKRAAYARMVRLAVSEPPRPPTVDVGRHSALRRSKPFREVRPPQPQADGGEPHARLGLKRGVRPRRRPRPSSSCPAGWAPRRRCPDRRATGHRR